MVAFSDSSKHAAGRGLEDGWRRNFKFMTVFFGRVIRCHSMVVTIEQRFLVAAFLASG